MKTLQKKINIAEETLLMRLKGEKFRGDILGGKNMEIINKVSLVFLLFGGTFSMLLGEETVTFKVLLAVMALDIVSGLLKATHQKRLKSFIMSWGIVKKGALILSILLFLLLDLVINNGTPVFGMMMTWVTIGNESLSIIENLEAMGVKIPLAISRVLLDMANTEDKDHEGNLFYIKEKALRDEERINEEE